MRFGIQSVVIGIFFILTVLALPVVAAKPRVIISFSQSDPDTAFARLYALSLEKSPFDGVCLEVDPRDADWIDSGYWKQQADWARSRNLDYLAEMYERPRENGSISWGGGGSLTYAGNTGPWNPGCTYTDRTFSRALGDLRAAPFKRMKWNLIGAGIMGPTTDWFNDEQWAQRCRNFAAIARFARKAGCKGMLFDDEQYGEGCAFNYDELRRRKAVRGSDFEAVRAMAVQRGREFAKAICKEFPDMVFWTLHGYGTTAWLVDHGLPEYARDLKPAFYDGILQGSSSRFTFVDGGEIAYGYNTRAHFEFGRRMIKEEPIRMKLTRVPALYRKKVRCGFGLWPDYYGRIDTANPENSYFSPGRFQRAVNLALEIGDGYVWTWGERFTWWVDGPDGVGPVPLHQGRRGLPLVYWDALKAGRTSPGSDTSERPCQDGQPHEGRNYCIDREKFPPLLAKCEKVYELPMDGWTFKLDDWGADSDDPKTFDKLIRIGTTWDKQGAIGKDTIGWYRLEFTLPADLKGRKLHFYFPEVEGSVWLSSRSCPNPQMMAWRYIKHDPASNRKPFVLTNPQVSDYFFEPGKPAVVVIKVQGHNGAGGILEPIQVLAER